MGIILLILLLMKSGINAEPERSLPDLSEKMVKLLLTCFDDHLNILITTPNLYDNFLQASLYSRPIPMMLMDEKFKPADIQRPLSHLATFVFAPHSSRSLGAMLRSVKSTPWWHINSLFFIVGNSQDGCKPAADILKRTWKMNLLSSFFLCYEPKKGVMLYTYNPYTNRAPRSWKEVGDFDRPDDRWTLYAHRYREGRMNCANINFDKKKFMDGYRVKGVAVAKLGVEWSKNKKYNLDSLSEKLASTVVAVFLQTLVRAMNLTAMINYDDPNFFQNGKPVGFLADLINGTYDIMLRPYTRLENMSSTYPLMQLTPRFVTQQRKFLSPVEKISDFYSTEIKYLTGIVLLITFVFILIIYKKREFALAAFDVLRLLLSTSLVVPLNRTAIRIFIFCVFQLIIILNATFQGNISAFLTKPERYYVDTLEDLQKYQCGAIAPDLLKNFIDESQAGMPPIDYVPDRDCIEHVLKNYSAACIGMTAFLLDSVIKYNLHISQSQLNKNYYSFLCREDWPLKEKFDHYISRLIEAGFYDYLYDHHVNIPLQKLKSREEQETAAQYRPIELADLSFAFQFLGIGLGVSTFIFMIEIFPRRKFLRMIKKMKKKWAKLSIISRLRWWRR